MVSLVSDDADELANHGRVEVGPCVHDHGGGALDGGQGSPQLMAHHSQELGPQPFQFLHVGHVLHGDDHGLDQAVVREDGCCVQQNRDAPPVGYAHDDLFCA